MSQPIDEIMPTRTRATVLAFRDLTDGLRQRELWLHLGWQDIKQRYQRSVIGPFWITIATAITAIAMGLVWSRLFNEKLSVFLPYIMVGFMFWAFIQAALLEGTQVFTSNEGLIKQIPAALSLHVYRLVWRQCIIFLHNIPVFALVMMVFPQHLHLSAFLIVPAAVLLVLNAVWVAIVFGTWCARYPDLSQLLTTVVTTLFLLTPIIWDPNKLRPNEHGHHLRTVLVELNPLFHYIVITRDPLLGRDVAGYHWAVVCGVTLLGLALAALTMIRYRPRVAYWV